MPGKRPRFIAEMKAAGFVLISGFGSTITTTAASVGKAPRARAQEFADSPRWDFSDWFWGDAHGEPAVPRRALIEHGSAMGIHTQRA